MKEGSHLLKFILSGVADIPVCSLSSFKPYSMNYSYGALISILFPNIRDILEELAGPSEG